MAQVTLKISIVLIKGDYQVVFFSKHRMTLASRYCFFSALLLLQVDEASSWVRRGLFSRVSARLKAERTPQPAASRPRGACPQVGHLRHGPHACQERLCLRPTDGLAHREPRFSPRPGRGPSHKGT